MSEEMDQVEMLAGMESMARMTHVFYASLVEEGFMHSDAMALTKVWLAATMSASITPSEEQGELSVNVRRQVGVSSRVVACVALHDVEDVESFAAQAVRKILAGNGGFLRREHREELTAFLTVTLYAIEEDWDPRRTPSFRLYASWLLQRRGTDWYRRTFHDSRSGKRMTETSLEALVKDNDAYRGSTPSPEGEVIRRAALYG